MHVLSKTSSIIACYTNAEQHEVTPKGKLRFALTARYIRPESIVSPTERERAIENGEVPDGIENLAYKGHEEDTTHIMS